jgi:hypothetical protein
VIGRKKERTDTRFQPARIAKVSEKAPRGLALRDAVAVVRKSGDGLFKAAREVATGPDSS